MDKRHYFFGKDKPSQLDPQYSREACRMYLSGDKVFIEGEMYDHEDNRRYGDSVSLSANKYREALAELQSKKEASVTTAQGDTVTFKIENNIVFITVCGSTSSSSTPNGAMRSSTAVYQATLEQLQFPKQL